MRANLPADLVPIFNRIKGTIRNAPGRSRTEALLEWVEAHPSEVWALHQERADKELRALAEEQRREVKLRKTRAELDSLQAVPF